MNTKARKPNGAKGAIDLDLSFRAQAAGHRGGAGLQFCLRGDERPGMPAPELGAALDANWGNCCLGCQPAPKLATPL